MASNWELDAALWFVRNNCAWLTSTEKLGSQDTYLEPKQNIKQRWNNCNETRPSQTYRQSGRSDSIVAEDSAVAPSAKVLVAPNVLLLDFECWGPDDKLDKMCLVPATIVNKC